MIKSELAFFHREYTINLRLNIAKYLRLKLKINNTKGMPF